MKTESKRQFDLEERTEKFAQEVRRALRQIKPSLMTESDIRQVIRSSGSVGANYIEANESVSKKDFALRIKYCRKEAKETAYWLRLLQDQVPPNVKPELIRLEQESKELTNIFGAIHRKSLLAEK
ncbi:MAG: four helix bundle protein [Verrucomicrobiota bacterium]